MEVKINREIKNYTESVFFGLSLRQFIFSVLGITTAILLYIFLKPILGTEITSWVCILGVLPFAAFGFVKYNGMNCEQLIKAWYVSEIKTPKVLTYKRTNTFYEIVKPKGGKKRK